MFLISFIQSHNWHSYIHTHKLKKGEKKHPSLHAVSGCEEMSTAWEPSDIIGYGTPERPIYLCGGEARSGEKKKNRQSRAWPDDCVYHMVIVLVTTNNY